MKEYEKPSVYEEVFSLDDILLSSYFGREDTDNDFDVTNIL